MTMITGQRQGFLDFFGISKENTLPTEKMRKHNGGYGMYYHIDMHGGPYAYEWVGNSLLSRMWEQMSMAYDYGVREIWVVNVGTLPPRSLPYPISSIWLTTLTGTAPLIPIIPGLI